MAVIIRYVNTASTTGGDGTTNATTGANRAYATIDEWETAEKTDLVAAGDSHVVHCEGSVADTIGISLTEWTTGVNNDLTIQVDSGVRHNGKWDTSAYRIETTDIPIDIQEDYVNIIGLQCDSQADNQCIGWAFGTSSGVLNVSNCILKKTASIGADDSGIGVVCHNGETKTVYYWNNIIYGFDTASNGRGIYMREDAGGTLTANLYNNTVESCYSGYRTNGSPTVTITNCVAFNCTDDFVGLGMTIDYCASDDGDGTNSVTPPNWLNVFIDYLNEDYHLKASDLDLIGAGTDDPGAGLYSDDINGNARTSVWDIGASEFVDLSEDLAFGVEGIIAEEFGVSSKIDESGQGVAGEIDENGQGVEGLF